MPQIVTKPVTALYTPNGVRMDKLLALSPKSIIDPERKSTNGYKYWRAQTLGAVALNLAEGRNVLNTHGGNVSHWSDSYEWVRHAAEVMAEWGGYTDNQFSSADEERLAQLAGIELGKSGRLMLPIGIVALNDTVEISPAPEGFPGFKHETPVGLHQLDPESIAAMQDIFEVPISQTRQ